MSQSLADLYNTAAQVLGNRGRLATVTTRSRYADVFDLWYDRIRRHVFAAAHWPSTAKMDYLALVRERPAGETWTNSDPDPGYARAFGVPADLLRPRMLASGAHFSMHKLGDVRVIATSEETPILRYTYDNTVIEEWENDLFLSVAYALASATALTLTGKGSYVQLAARQANDIIRQARAASASEDDDPKITVASWHAARGYMGNPSVARYVFPHGDLVSAGVSASVE